MKYIKEKVRKESEAYQVVGVLETRGEKECSIGRIIAKHFETDE